MAQHERAEPCVAHATFVDAVRATRDQPDGRACECTISRPNDNDTLAAGLWEDNLETVCATSAGAAGIEYTQGHLVPTQNGFRGWFKTGPALGRSRGDDVARGEAEGLCARQDGREGSGSSAVRTRTTWQVALVRRRSLARHVEESYKARAGERAHNYDPRTNYHHGDDVYMAVSSKIAYEYCNDVVKFHLFNKINSRYGFTRNLGLQVLWGPYRIGERRGRGRDGVRHGPLMDHKTS